MNVTIFGSGYVGLVTAACLAEVGNDVLCVDVDRRKIEGLLEGRLPIYEPGLEELVVNNHRNGRLDFTTDVVRGVDFGALLFIAVGTPPNEDGSADLQHVLAVARGIGQHMRDYRIVVNKSTVPVGTADKVAAAIKEELAGRRLDIDFDVVSNPEFLKEGAAVNDFMRPDRIIIGTADPEVAKMLRTLYAPFNRNHERVVQMEVRSAELTKYAANAMLATKISFMNELANLAELLDADIEQVRLGIGADPRIGYEFIYPGCGYGGSCFPKDVKALDRIAREAGYEAHLIRAVDSVNDRQKHVLFDKIAGHFRGDLAGKTIALWGLAFKPNTDDMREASSRVLIEALWARGARIKAYDPEASAEARRIYGERSDFHLCRSPEEAVVDADALAIVTEWNVFRSPDFAHLKRTMKNPLIFDGRNLYNLQTVAAEGFVYYSIGRRMVA